MFFYSREIKFPSYSPRFSTKATFTNSTLIEGVNRLCADAGINQLEGVGVSEVPRGTLFHHYQVDENGLMQKVNLIIATGQNNLANAGVKFN